MKVDKNSILGIGIGLVAIAILGFAFAITTLENRCAVHSSNPKHSKAQGAGEQPNPDQGAGDAKSGAPSTLVAKSISEKTSPSNSTKEPHDKFREHFYCENSLSEFGVAWFTFFLFIATGALWFVTYSLAREAKDGAEGQAKNMVDSIAAAGRAATAMEGVAKSMSANVDLVKKMQENIPKQLRAYVSIRAVWINPAGENGMPFVQLSIINTGQTPAHEVDIARQIFMLPHPLPQNYIMPSIQPQGIKTVIHGKDSNMAGAEGTSALNAAQLASVQHGGKQRLYVVVTVTYRDVFTEPHFTEFCVSIANLRETKEGWAAYFEHAPVHNEAN